MSVTTSPRRFSTRQVPLLRQAHFQVLRVQWQKTDVALTESLVTTGFEGREGPARHQGCCWGWGRGDGGGGTKKVSVDELGQAEREDALGLVRQTWGQLGQGAKEREQPRRTPRFVGVGAVEKRVFSWLRTVGPSEPAISACGRMHTLWKSKGVRPAATGFQSRGVKTNTTDTNIRHSIQQEQNTHSS